MANNSSDSDVPLEEPGENIMRCTQYVRRNFTPTVISALCKHHILSIDIGIKNLGYSIISFDKLGKKQLTDLAVEFDIFDISKHLPKKTDIVSSRCEALIQFFRPLFQAYGHFRTIIIERQVNRNTMAMELMYAITMALKLLNSGDGSDEQLRRSSDEQLRRSSDEQLRRSSDEFELVIFDPKDKFLKLGLTYSTANKAHKKQSAKYARNLMSKIWKTELAKFDKFDKKDDISDAVNQALVWMLSNGFLSLTVEQYVQLINE